MNNFETLILSGGGIKGIAIVSALELLENKNYLKNIKRVVGSSIGALIAFGIASKINCKTIKEILINIDLSKLIDIDFNLFFEKYGFNDFDYLDKLLKILLTENNMNPDITFKELKDKNNIDLIVVCTNLSYNTAEYFCSEKTPNISVIKAVKTSASYPIASIPTEINGSYYSDGGIVSPFPSELISKHDRKSTLGVLIQNDSNTKIEIETLKDYIFSIMSCALNSLMYWELRNLKYKLIIYSNMAAMDLDCSDDKKKELENIGKQYAQKYINKLEKKENKV